MNKKCSNCASIYFIKYSDLRIYKTQTMHSFVATGISDVSTWCNNSSGKGKTKDERLRMKDEGERGKGIFYDLRFMFYVTPES